MKDWAKWQLIDYRIPNRHQELRFDEIESLIQEGEIGQSDLVCAPGSNNYQPISECTALHYVYTKAFYDMHHEKNIKPNYLEYHFNLPINKRTAFVQENYFFSDFYKKRKLELLQRCAHPLLKILKPKEEINFIFSAEADINLPRLFSALLPKGHFLETLVIVTNFRIIQAHWNKGHTRAESFKSVALENMNQYQFKPKGRNRFRLSLGLFRQHLFSWSNVNQVDRVQLEVILQARIPVGSFPKVPRKQAWIPNLCKTCYSGLSHETLQCPLCDAEYVSAQEAKRLSQLLPGLGWIHAGWPIMGYLWIIGEGTLILLALIALFLVGPESWRRILLSMSTLLLLAGIHREISGGIANLIRELRPMVDKPLTEEISSSN